MFRKRNVKKKCRKTFDKYVLYLFSLRKHETISGTVALHLSALFSGLGKYTDTPTQLEDTLTAAVRQGAIGTFSVDQMLADAEDFSVASVNAVRCTSHVWHAQNVSFVIMGIRVNGELNGHVRNHKA